MIPRETHFGPHLRCAVKAVVATFVIAAVAACKTQSVEPPKLSLDEAKEVTAEFSGPFTAPPRTINDIFALIEQVEHVPELCLYEALSSQEDVRASMLANKVTGRRGEKQRADYASEQALLQFYQGNIQRSITYMGWAIDQYSAGRWVAADFIAQLAAYHAYAGQFDKAGRVLDEAVYLQSRIKPGQWGRYKASLYWLRFHVAESQATTAASKGKLVVAEAFYRKALKIAQKLYFDERVDFAEVALARILMRQGRLLEAESLLRERLKNQLPTTSPMVAITMLRFSEVLYEQGRYVDADRMARAAVEMFKGTCTTPVNLLLADARNVLAKSLVARQRWQDALEQYDVIRRAFAEHPETYGRLFSGNLYLAIALLRTGQLDAASKNLQKALERSQSRLGRKHYNTAEIQGFLAMIQRAKGAQGQALVEFAAATEILLTRSREAGGESDTSKARDQRLNLILESYMGLLVEIRGTDLENTAGVEPVSKAFQLAEAARSRAIQRALAASGSRAVLKDPALSDLARREQDAQKQITALYGTLAKELSRPPAELSTSRVEDLRVTIDQLRGARAALIEEIETRFPDYAELINPKPLSLELARAILRPGEALISTYVGEERTYVWAIPHSGEAAFATVGVGREDLSDKVAHLRGALEPYVQTLGDIPEFDVAAAYGLYESLLAPVKAGWWDAESLLVVAHGPLGYLPLSVLPTEPVKLAGETRPLFGEYKDVPWLARSHAVTMLPSVGSLKALRGLPPGQGTRQAFVGFGDPWFSLEQAQAAQSQAVAALVDEGMTTRGLPVSFRAVPKTQEVDSAELALLPRLPETADEVRSMAVAMNADLTASVFVGKEANEGRVKSMDLSGVRVLVFATHGLVPGDLNGLQEPALALSSPKVVGGDDDGLLTMGEILGLKLNADWVVLSACNTGSGDGAGAEAVSGLGQAFFYAGTRALLVSNWPVETASAKTLTTDLFRRQAADPGLSRSEALRQAMIGLIDGPGRIDSDTGKSVFYYAHPIFWAPFSLIGDGGGGKPAS